MKFAMRILAAVCASLTLVACGGGDTIEVTVNRSPASTAAPLLLASVAEAEQVLPGMKVVKSRPSDRELQYVFPGDGRSKPARLMFEFEPVADGKATLVHASVEVPAIIATVDGQKKVLSERKISAELKRILNAMAKGDSQAQTTTRMSMLLVALAISTDQPLRERAFAMAKNPALALGDLLDAESSGRDPQVAAADRNDPTEFDKPHDDSEDFAPNRTSSGYEEADEASE